MDNKFENHVKSDKVKWIVVFLALILLAVGLLSVSTDGFKALRRDKSPVDSTEIPVEDEGGGSVLTEGKSNGMKLAGAKLTSEEYEANGVSEQADSVYTITATVTPAKVTDPTVLWTAEWTNGASAWASGKAVTEYLSLTPSANTLTATLVCKKEFGEQAIITAKAKSNEDAAASCTVDYVKRVTSVSITAPSKIAFSSSGTSYTVLATPNYGTGTLTPDTFTITGGTLVKNVKTTNAVHKSVTNSSAGTITTYTRSAVEKDLTFSGRSFSVTTPYDAFVSDTQTSSGTQLMRAKGNDLSSEAPKVLPVKIVYGQAASKYQPMAVSFHPSVATLISTYNNSFANNATGTNKDGTLTIQYTYSYRGNVYGSSSVSTGIAFDASGIVTVAETLGVDYDKIVF